MLENMDPLWVAPAAPAIGVDLCDIERIRDFRARWEAQGTQKIFELEAKNPEFETYLDETLAGFFAAKEAVMKCLGTGMGCGVGFNQIEIVRTAGGMPQINLSGRALEIAEHLKFNHWSVSISHSKHQAIATVIATSV